MLSLCPKAKSDCGSFLNLDFKRKVRNKDTLALQIGARIRVTNMAKTKKKISNVKKRGGAQRYLSDVAGPKYQVRKKLRHFNWPLALALACATALLLAIQHIWLLFFSASAYGGMILNVYMVITALCILLFLIFNRGMRRDSTSEDKLPQEWSQEQKDAYMKKEQQFRTLSRVFMGITIPFAFVVAFDFVLMLLGWI